MTKTSIYHFLCGALGQEVSVAQVVDFDVLDVVTIRDVHVAVDLVRGCCRARGAARGGLGADWRDVDMLDALARLELSIDLGSGGSYCQISTLARMIKPRNRTIIALSLTCSSSRVYWRLRGRCANVSVLGQWASVANRVVLASRGRPRTPVESGGPSRFRLLLVEAGSLGSSSFGVIHCGRLD